MIIMCTSTFEVQLKWWTNACCYFLDLFFNKCPEHVKLIATCKCIFDSSRARTSEIRACTQPVKNNCTPTFPMLFFRMKPHPNYHALIV